MANGKLTLEEILPSLRSPRSHAPLYRDGDRLLSHELDDTFAIVDGTPDLKVAPERVSMDLAWVDPFKELPSLKSFQPPTPLHADDLPHHLDPWLASCAGTEGDGRWI